MPIERRVDYLFGVTGERKVEDALGRVDDAAERAGQGADKAGASFRGLSQAMQDGLRPVDENLKGFDALQGRVGQLKTAVELLSGVAIFNMVRGMVDAARAMADWATGAAEAKERQDELEGAVKSATAAIEEQMLSQALAAALSAGATVEIIKAQNEATKASDKLTSALAEQVAAEEDLERTRTSLAEATRDLAETQAKFDRALKESPSGAEALARQLIGLRQRVTTLNAEVGRAPGLFGRFADSASLAATGFEALLAQARLSSQVNDSASTLAGTISRLVKGFREAAAAATKTTTAVKGTRDEIEALLDALNKLDVRPLADRLGIGDVSAEIEELLGDSSESVGLLLGLPDQFANAWEEAVDRASPAVLGFFDQVNEELQRTAMMREALAPVVNLVEAQGDALAAAAVDALIFGESFEAALNQAANAALREAAIGAVIETAKGLAASALAAFGVPNAAAAASAHFAAAAAYGGVALVAGAAAGATGGVGGGAPASGPSVPGSDDLASPTDTDDGARQIVINANFLGQPLHTRTDIQDAIVGALDSASRRRGRRRFDAAAFARRT